MYILFVLITTVCMHSGVPNSHTVPNKRTGMKIQLQKISTQGRNLLLQKNNQYLIKDIYNNSPLNFVIKDICIGCYKNSTNN